MRRVVLFAALACLAGYVYAYSSGRAGAPIRSDAFSYYVYLPSWLLHHDPSLEAVAADCCGGTFPGWTAIVRWPRTNHWVDAHPIGEAILIAPFFLVAHALTRWTNLSPDGFSPYYQHAAGLAGLSYVILGLWFLQRLLRRHFTEPVTAATLAALLLGTSLFHYATFDSTWSHAFSFALCAALLERLDAWRPAFAKASEGESVFAFPVVSAFRRNVAAPEFRLKAEATQIRKELEPARFRDDLLIGVLAGLMILVRHTNIVVPVCFVAAAGSRRLALTTMAVAGVVVFPQLWLYHLATGRWLISSYGDMGFTFADPHLWGVLGGVTKGLFWAPLLLIAVAGFAWLPPSLRRWRVPAAIVFTVHTYIIASWWDWQFGGSFGHRGFVDLYPLLAPGLASAFARSAAVPRSRAIVTVAVVMLCALSIFQMLQYWHGVLPISDTTWPMYRAAFLRGWW